MAQVTIYLDDELAQAVRARAQAAGQSVSAFIAQLLRAQERREWSPGFWEAVGTIPDFPTAEEIRTGYGDDLPRVPPFDDAER